MRISIGGFIKHSSTSREQLPVQDAPSVEQVQAYLDAVKGKFGVISIDKQSEDGAGIVELTLYAQGGTYLLLLSEPSESNGMEVRTYRNPKAPDEFVEILGESHHASTTFNDFAIAKKAFLEFCATGDVSRALLS